MHYCQHGPDGKNTVLVAVNRAHYSHGTRASYIVDGGAKEHRSMAAFTTPA